MGCISKNGLSAPSRRREKVMLPECGVDAYVNVEEIGAKDLHALRTKHHPPKEGSFFDFEYDLLSRSLVDDDGKKLFQDSDDVKDHTDLSPTTLYRLVQEVMKVSGLGAEKN